MGPVVESPYGNEVDPSKAPEAISNAVASLPPEQMYELMRQMKLCVRNNPTEARTMLMNNPQLAYALLQAQVNIILYTVMNLSFSYIIIIEKVLETEVTAKNEVQSLVILSNERKDPVLEKTKYFNSTHRS